MGIKSTDEDVFEYTLEDVLTRRYDTVYSNKYYVNYGYMVDHVEELILLKDVVIPCSIPPLPKVRELISKRMEEDWETYGIYRWEEMYSKEVPRSIDEMREDDVRLALDIAKKYPEYSDIICLRDVEENFTNFPHDLNNFSTFKEFDEAFNPVREMIDIVYSNLINDELIYLEDFIPSEFLSDYAYKKRFSWIYTEKPVLFEIWKLYLEQRRNFDTTTEKVIFVMGEMKDFIDKHPQYSQLIKDPDAFEKRLWDLKKELYGL